MWSSESLFCKPHIKIPVSASSSENSLSTSPRISPDLITIVSMERTSGKDSASETSADSRLVDERESSGEEVRSKLDVGRRRRKHVISVDTTAKCDESGVKSISDILKCADLQLKSSQLFMEKLAKRR